MLLAIFAAIALLFGVLGLFLVYRAIRYFKTSKVGYGFALLTVGILAISPGFVMVGTIFYGELREQNEESQPCGAISRNDVGSIETQIENGLDVDMKCDGRTLLGFAAELGRIEIVKILVDAGADINAVGYDSDGKTALLLAATRTEEFHKDNYSQLVLYLLRKGADPAQRGARLVLHGAVENLNYEVAKALIGKGAPVNSQTNYGHTPLHELLMSCGRADCVEIKKIALLLTQNGADTMIRDKKGITSLELMKKCKQEGCIITDTTKPPHNAPTTQPNDE